MKDEVIALIAFVLATPIRREMMKLLCNKYATPSGLSKEMDISIQLTHSTLKELESNGLVKQIKGVTKRRNIFCLSDTGIEVCENLEKYSKMMLL